MFELINKRLPSRICNCINSVGSMILLYAEKKSRSTTSNEKYFYDIDFIISYCRWRLFFNEVEIVNDESNSEEFEFMCSLICNSDILQIKETIPNKELLLILSDNIEIIISAAIEEYGNEAELISGFLFGKYWDYTPAKGFRWKN